MTKTEFLKKLEFAGAEEVEVDWSLLDGMDWACLLIDQPRFATHCDWSLLDGVDWSFLLRSQPRFAPHCDWGKLDGEDWSYLLSARPKFAEYKKENRDD